MSRAFVAFLVGSVLGLACSQPVDLILETSDPAALEDAGTFDAVARAVRGRLAATGMTPESVRLERNTLIVRLSNSPLPDQLPLLEPLLARAGRLEFRIVTDDGDASDLDLGAERDEVVGRIAGEMTLEALNAELAARPARPNSWQWYRRRDAAESEPLPLLDANAVHPGKHWSFGTNDLSKVYMTLDQTAYLAVGFELLPERMDAFASFTGNYVGRQLAVVLDGEVLSAPRIDEALPGRGVIRGKRDMDDARVLMGVLRGGVLLQPLRVRTIRPVK